MPLNDVAQKWMNDNRSYLIERVNPFDLLPHLHSAFTSADIQRVTNKTERHGNENGMVELLEIYERKARNFEFLSHALRLGKYDAPAALFDSTVKPVYISKKPSSSKFSRHFENHSFIGHGAFGYVYKADKKRSKDCFAIKMIAQPSINQKDLKRFLEREVKVLKELDHQNIVALHDVWGETIEDLSAFLSKLDLPKQVDDQDDSESSAFESSDSKQNNQSLTSDNYNKSTTSAVQDMEEYTQARASTAPVVQRFCFIQMEYCFKTLKKWMDDCLRMEDRGDISKIFSQTLNGVGYIHSKGLVHRDLKPDNILMSKSMDVKIGDFGLVAGMFEEEKRRLKKFDKSYSLISLSRSQSIPLVNGPYVASEIRDGQYYSSKSDMYSLGLVLFELLHPMGTRSEAYDKFTMIKANRQKLGEFIGIEDAQVVANLIARNPMERYGSDEYLYWMTKFCSELSVGRVGAKAAICPDFMSANCNGAVVAARNFNIVLKNAVEERLRANQSTLTFVDNDDNVNMMKVDKCLFDKLLLKHEEYNTVQDDSRKHLFFAPYEEGVLLFECNKTSVQYSDYEFGLSIVLTKVTEYHLGQNRKWESKSYELKSPLKVNDVETKGENIYLLSKNLAVPQSMREDDHILLGNIKEQEKLFYVNPKAIITDKNIGRFSLCQDLSRNLLATIHGNNQKIPEGEEKCVKVWKGENLHTLFEPSAVLLWSVSFNAPICGLCCAFYQKSLLLAVAREPVSPDIADAPIKYPSEIWEVELQVNKPKLIGKVGENIDSLATVANVLYFKSGNRFYAGMKTADKIPSALQMTEIAESQSLLCWKDGSLEAL